MMCRFSYSFLHPLLHQNFPFSFRRYNFPNFLLKNFYCNFRVSPQGRGKVWKSGGQRVMWWTHSDSPAPDLNRVNNSVGRGRGRQRTITPPPALWVRRPYTCRHSMARSMDFKILIHGKLRDKGLVLIWEPNIWNLGSWKYIIISTFLTGYIYLKSIFIKFTCHSACAIWIPIWILRLQISFVFIVAIFRGIIQIQLEKGFEHTRLLKLIQSFSMQL